MSHPLFTAPSFHCAFSFYSEHIYTAGAGHNMIFWPIRCASVKIFTSFGLKHFLRSARCHLDRVTVCQCYWDCELLQSRHNCISYEDHSWRGRTWGGSTITPFYRITGANMRQAHNENLMFTVEVNLALKLSCFIHTNDILATTTNLKRCIICENKFNCWEK